jgi:radial spoke head protein 4A
LENEKIYEHLGKVVDRVVAENPKDAYGLVEVLSRMVKESGSASGYPAAPTEEELEERASYSQKIQVLNKVPVDEEAPIPVCAIPDYMEEADLLAWAGVGFGQLESYKITCSLRNLAAKEREASLTKLRFWGKILGTDKDYYVAEAQSEAGGEVPEGEEDMEVPGAPGVNQYIYYVTNDLCEDWTKLPDLKPREVIAARQIKKLCSGDLKSKVVTVPYFPGKEDVYLRAQIAQITADTVLCVNGYLAPEDPEDPDNSMIMPDPEFYMKLPSGAELKNLEKWTHYCPHILKNGRTTHKATKDELLEGIVEEEGDESAEANATIRATLLEMENDPQRKILRTAAADELKWVVKQSGDDAVYKDPLPGPEGAVRKPRSNLVTCVRSPSWPGAVCAARGVQFTNLYVGYGLPAGMQDFFLRAPPDVQDEPEDRVEVEEPNGAVEAEAAVEEE